MKFQCLRFSDEDRSEKKERKKMKKEKKDKMRERSQDSEDFTVSFEIFKHRKNHNLKQKKYISNKFHMEFW